MSNWHKWIIVIPSCTDVEKFHVMWRRLLRCGRSKWATETLAQGNPNLKMSFARYEEFFSRSRSLNNYNKLIKRMRSRGYLWKCRVQEGKVSDSCIFQIEDKRNVMLFLSLSFWGPKYVEMTHASMMNSISVVITFIW